jgi:ubiquinone biosynthesis protein
MKPLRGNLPIRHTEDSARRATGNHMYRLIDTAEQQAEAFDRYKRKQTIANELIPRPLVREKARPPIVIGRHRKRTRFPLLRVLKLFSGYTLRNVGQKLLGRYDADEAAVRLRKIFEQLGGLWIKVGQLIAMRNDLLSDAVCRELSRLQSQAVGFSFEHVRTSIKTDLNREIEEVFEEFDPVPFAAASISQVHFARLHGEREPVCVKVLRPDADRTFMRDLEIIRKMIRIFGYFGIGRHLHLDEALYELELMVREELDFRYEASNMRRMRKTLKGHSIYVPRVFTKVSGQHTLVTEYIDGVLMTDFIEVGRRDPHARDRWCAANDVEPKRVARKLFLSAMRQLFEDNLFHADLHPGNILLLRENRVALIDFGTVGRSGKTFLANYRSSLTALAEQDFAKATDISLMMTISPPAIDDIKPLRKELIRLYREWDGRTHLMGVDYHERSMAAAGGASGKIMAKYNVQLSWEFMRVSRTWATLDASVSHLYPDANYMNLFRRYFKSAARRKRKLGKIIPQAAMITRNVTAAVGEYETMLGPAIRKRAIYSTAAGQMSERFALSIVAFLKMIKWAIYIAVFGAAIAFIDAHSADIEWVEEDIQIYFRALLDRIGTLGLVVGMVLFVIVSFYLSQAINRLTPKI